MPHIPLARVRTGMKAASPILDSTGTLLVRQGAELTPEILQRLANRKIETVEVESDAGPASPAPAPAASFSRPDADEVLAHAFAPAMGSEIMKALYEAAREFHRTRRERKV